jgi:hypothetical protein
MVKWLTIRTNGRPNWHLSFHYPVYPDKMNDPTKNMMYKALIVCHYA